METEGVISFKPFKMNERERKEQSWSLTNAFYPLTALAVLIEAGSSLSNTPRLRGWHQSLWKSRSHLGCGWVPVGRAPPSHPPQPHCSDRGASPSPRAGWQNHCRPLSLAVLAVGSSPPGPSKTSCRLVQVPRTSSSPANSAVLFCFRGNKNFSPGIYLLTTPTTLGTLPVPSFPCLPPHFLCYTQLPSHLVLSRLHGLFRPLCLGPDQRSANLFCQGADSKYSRLCRPEGLCCNYSTPPWKGKSKHGPGCLCPSKGLFTRARGRS